MGQLAQSSVSQDDRMFGMLSHALALPGAFIPILGNLLGPFLMFWFKKDEGFVGAHIKESLNFQIIMAIVYLVLLTLALKPLIWIYRLVLLGMVGFAAFKAFQGEEFKYPASYRFIQ